MFDSGAIKNELHALQGDVSRLMNATRESILDSATHRTDAIADQIKAVLNDLNETLHEQEERVEAIISDRPITSLGSAFALGVIVGFMLRRH